MEGFRVENDVLGFSKYGKKADLIQAIEHTFISCKSENEYMKLYNNLRRVLPSLTCFPQYIEPGAANMALLRLQNLRYIYLNLSLMIPNLQKNSTQAPGSLEDPSLYV